MKNTEHGGARRCPVSKPYLEDGRLIDADAVDVCLRVSAARRHRHDALGVRDDAVPRHHVRPVQRQALGLRRLVAVDGPVAAHLRHVELQPVPLRRRRHDVCAVCKQKAVSQGPVYEKIHFSKTTLKQIFQFFQRNFRNKLLVNWQLLLKKNLQNQSNANCSGKFLIFGPKVEVGVERVGGRWWTNRSSGSAG